MDPLKQLTSRLREEAALLRRRGLEREAALEESIVEEIEIALREYRSEELTLREAAEETGYSRKRLREMVREGKLPDNRPEGSQGKIKVRRCDLPRKPRGDREDVSPVDRIHARLSR